MLPSYLLSSVVYNGRMQMPSKVVYGRVEWVQPVTLRSPLMLVVPTLFAMPLPCVVTAASGDGSCNVTLEVQAPPFIAFAPGTAFELAEPVRLGLQAVAEGTIVSQ